MASLVRQLSERIRTRVRPPRGEGTTLHHYEDVLKSVEIEVAVSRTTVVKHGWTKNTKWEETANVSIPRQ